MKLILICLIVINGVFTLVGSINWWTIVKGDGIGLLISLVSFHAFYFFAAYFAYKLGVENERKRLLLARNGEATARGRD